MIKSHIIILLMSAFSCVLTGIKAQSVLNVKSTSKVTVWDTYVTKKDGRIMHFDILAPINIKDPKIIHNYGKQYLKEKGQQGQKLTSKECRKCHIETIRPHWKKSINARGYFIIEMEGCN